MMVNFLIAVMDVAALLVEMSGCSYANQRLTWLGMILKCFPSSLVSNPCLVMD